jgi:nucleoid DNA-binding protein
LELEQVIQLLLSQFDFVSLPGLGSFVKRRNPAKVSNDRSTIEPPSEYYIFDASRTFDDEAITNYLCNTLGIDHKEAELRVKQFVERVNNALNSSKHFEFPGVGTLLKNDNSNITLEFDAGNAATESYGLSAIEALPKQKADSKLTGPKENKNAAIAETQASSPLPTEQTTKIPTPKPADTKKSRVRLWIPITACVVVAAVVVCWFTPALHFWEQPQATVVPSTTDSSSSMASGGNLPLASAIPDSIEGETDSQTFDSIPASSQPKATDEYGAEKILEQTTIKKVALSYTEPPVVETGKAFYIVAGSFTSEANAQKFLNELAEKGYKPTLIPRNKLYSVSLYTFSNRDRALRELERLKSEQTFEKLWLLSQ